MIKISRFSTNKYISQTIQDSAREGEYELYAIYQMYMILVKT